jgi:quinoprotein dehydrogenase-associated probable ABC transporter substrate-binding protein
MVHVKTPTLILALSAICLLAAYVPASAQELNRALDKSFEDLTPPERIAVRAAAKVAYEKKKLKNLHVCADPGNMPLSNDKQQGFENKIVDVLGKALGAKVTYYWRPLIERGMTRQTFDERVCDVMVDIPEDYDPLLVTEPLYRSTYVLAYPSNKGLHITGLNDPQLKTLTIGVYQTSGIRQALAERGIYKNVVLQVQSHNGDLVPQNQPWYIVQKAMDGQVDVAGVWGPFAGWVKTIKHEPITIVPVNLDEDHVPLEFSLGLGVRKTDVLLKYMLEFAMEDHAKELEAILKHYGVPLVDCSKCIVQGNLPSHGSYTAIPVTAAETQPTKAAETQAMTDMKKELAAGADPTQELFDAVTADDAQRVNYLAKHGAKLNALDSTGSAPIHIAATGQDAPMVKLLIKLGADPNLPDSSGMTPLLYSVLRDDINTTKVLLDAGVDVNKQNLDGYTPLAMAIEEQRYEAAKLLINSGANVNTPVGKDKLTPLMIAAAQMHAAEGTVFLPSSTRPIDIDKMLIKRGANVNAQSTTGMTALMVAATRDNAEAIGLLLNSGANPDVKNKAGQTALQLANLNDAQSAAQAITVLSRMMPAKRAQTAPGAKTDSADP